MIKDVRSVLASALKRAKIDVHSSLSLIEKTCGHLLNVRHRSPVAEYREARVLAFREQVEGA